MSIASFLKILREESAPTLWSKAVSLARRNIFHFEPHPDNKKDYKIMLRDVSEGVNPRVELLIEAEDWTCDCLSKADPCVHVLAAAIVLKRESDLGRPVPTLSAAENYVVYEWKEQAGSVFLQRSISSDATFKVQSLKNFISGFKKKFDFTPSKVDLQVDAAMDDVKNYGNQFKFRRNLLKAMQSLDARQWKGSVKSAEPKVSGFTFKMRDQPNGTLIQIERSNAAFFSNGFVVEDETIYLLPESEEWQRFQGFMSKPITLAGYEVEEFKSKILPKLQKVFGWDVPKDSYQSLGLYLYLFGVRKKQTLEITPRIGYGKPMEAVLQQGRLKMMTSAPPPLRRQDEERELKDQLWQKHKLTIDETAVFKNMDDFKKLSSLVARGLIPYDFKMSDFQVIGELSPFEIDKMDIGHNFKWPENQFSDIDVIEVIKSAEKGQSFIERKGEGLIAIPKDWIQKNSFRFMDALPPEKGSGSKNVNYSNKSWRTQLKKISETSDDLEKIFNRQIKLTKADLRSYQKEGVRWLLSLKSLGLGALLADDMGLGKTLQTIVTMNGCDLVICPTSVMSNWKREVERFRPDLEVFIYHGSSRKLQYNKKTVIITSYGVLRSDVDALSEVEWNSVVADESQVVKNPKSIGFSALTQMNPKFAIALSGTPVENKPDDLWAQMHFIMPGLLFKHDRFRKEFSTQRLLKDSERLDYLRDRTAPFIRRRMKSEVAKDLPKKTVAVRTLKMTEDEQLFYQNCHKLVSDQISKSEEKNSVMELLTILLKLRQSCCHQSLVDAKSGASTLSTKQQYLIDRVRTLNEAGHKCLVVSQWTSFLDILENSIELSSLRIDGQTKDRQKVVDQFQNDDDISVMFLSLKAGGVGLNLTAADYVFMMDPWWNPAAELQAQDRAYRIGQNKPVFVERLILEGSIEEGILALQEQKQALRKGLLDGMASPDSIISREDIINLLQS